MVKPTLLLLFTLSLALAAEKGHDDASSPEVCVAAPGSGSADCHSPHVDPASTAPGLSLIQTRSALRTLSPASTSDDDTDLAEPSDSDLLLLEEDDFIARATAAKWKFEEKLPAIIAGSVAALTEATPYFEKKLPGDDDKPDPAAMIQGITVLAKHLFKIFKTGFIELVEKETPGFDWNKFEKDWNNMFNRIPRKIGEVDKLLKEFSQEGKTHALIRAIGKILEAALKEIKSFLPPKVEKDVAKYFSICTRTVNSIGKSWAAFESGDGAKGAEAMYEGIKGNVDALLPEKLKNDATYKTIMGSVDHVMSKLNDTVMKFKKKMTESRVCIKKEKSRKSKRPTVCPKGMVLQGKICKSLGGRQALMALFGLSHGLKQKEDAEVAEEEVEEEDSSEKDQDDDVTAALQNRAVGVRVKDEEKTTDVEDALTGKRDEDKIYAECDEDGQYPDMFKDKCYKKCPDGYTGAGKSCSQDCKSPFSSSSGDWCGKSSTAIGNAKMQIVISAINAAASIAITIATAVSNGKDKEAKPALDLSGTIDSLTNAAVAFVFPGCPF